MDDLSIGHLGSTSAFFCYQGLQKRCREHLYITQTSKKYDILGYYLEGKIWLGVSNIDCFIGGFPCQKFQTEGPVELVRLSQTHGLKKVVYKSVKTRNLVRSDKKEV